MNNGSGNMREKKKPFIWLTVFFLLTVGSIILALICLHKAEIPFIVMRIGLFSVLVIVALCILFGFCVWFVLADKGLLVKAFLSVYILILFFLAVLLILQATGFFRLIKDAETLRAYLESSGRWMPFMYVALQYLQVVILPIPSIVSTVAGVALFGAFKTLLYSLIGIFCGSLTAFLIGRKLGNKAVAWMVGAETLEKWQKKLKGKDNLVLTTMFLLPVFPDDILCFVAGLSTMSTAYFIVMIFVSRILAISATCFSFDFIPFNTWWGLLIWGILIAILIAAFILIYKNLDKIQVFLSKRFKVFRKKGK